MTLLVPIFCLAVLVFAILVLWRAMAGWYRAQIFEAQVQELRDQQIARLLNHIGAQPTVVQNLRRLGWHPP